MVSTMSSFHFRALDSLGTDDSKARIITALQQGHDNSSVFHHLLPAGDAPDLTQASEQLDERVYRPLTCSHFIDQETEAERISSLSKVSRAAHEIRDLNPSLCQAKSTFIYIRQVLPDQERRGGLWIC